jgi:hypothetical protein
MGGSVLQLAAVGKQDIFLIGNPQITFFKSVYKRHTNFAIESIPLNFKGNVDFGNKIKCLIERKGDLISNMMLEIKLPALENGISWVNGIGNVMIDRVELEIGGEIIDTIHGSFLDIYHELCNDEGQRAGYNKMVGKTDYFNRFSHNNAMSLYIPLPFWFCRDIGKSLPLIALQYHDVELNLYLRPFNETWYSGSDMSNIPDRVSIVNAFVSCDYIFLDVPERKYFAQNMHSYLIEQHQINMGNPVLEKSPKSKVNLDLNLPVKELYWIYQANDVAVTNDWLNYSNTIYDDMNPLLGEEPINIVELRLNGLDRFIPREGNYFRLVLPYQRHNRISDKYIYNYTFCFKPEEVIPTGSLDFSWINSAELVFYHPTEILAGNITIFAINYNILEIKNGMANKRYNS